MVDDGQHREPEDLDADDRGHRPMEPLDPGLRVVEGRDDLVVAERPIRTAQAGIRGADDDADRDQQDRGPERQRRELLEAGQRVSWGGRGRSIRAEPTPHSSAKAGSTDLGYPSTHAPPTTPDGSGRGRPCRGGVHGHIRHARWLGRGPRRLGGGGLSGHHGARARDGHELVRQPDAVGHPADHRPGRDDRLRREPPAVLVHRPEDQRPGRQARSNGVAGVLRPREGHDQAGLDRGSRIHLGHPRPGRRLQGRGRHPDHRACTARSSRPRSPAAHPRSSSCRSTCDRPAPS